MTYSQLVALVLVGVASAAILVGVVVESVVRRRAVTRWSADAGIMPPGRSSKDATVIHYSATSIVGPGGCGGTGKFAMRIGEERLSKEAEDFIALCKADRKARDDHEVARVDRERRAELLIIRCEDQLKKIENSNDLIGIDNSALDALCVELRSFIKESQP